MTDSSTLDRVLPCDTSVLLLDTPTQAGLTRAEVTTEQPWARALIDAIAAKDDVQHEIDIVPSALGWPKVNDFPRPGAAAGWGHTEWAIFARQHGYEFERETAHAMFYTHPSGLAFSTSKTTSDCRSSLAAMTQTRRALRAHAAHWMCLFRRLIFATDAPTAEVFWSRFPQELKAHPFSSNKDEPSDIPLALTRSADTFRLVAMITREAKMGLHGALTRYGQCDSTVATRLVAAVNARLPLLPLPYADVVAETLVAIRSEEAVAEAVKRKQREEREAKLEQEAREEEAERQRLAAEANQPANRHQAIVADYRARLTTANDTAIEALRALGALITDHGLPWSGEPLEREVEQLRAEVAAGGERAAEVEQLRVQATADRERIATLEREVAAAHDLVTTAASPSDWQRRYEQLALAVKRIDLDGSLGTLSRSVTAAQLLIAHAEALPAACDTPSQPSATPA